MANEKWLIDANRTRYELNIAYCDNHGERRRGVGDAIEIINMMPTVDAVEVVHAYWTGLTPSDYTFAEGFSDRMTQEERAKIHEDFMHTTHCSNCNGGVDDRLIRYWRYCPYCGAKMDGGNRNV